VSYEPDQESRYSAAAGQGERPRGLGSGLEARHRRLRPRRRDQARGRRHTLQAGAPTGRRARPGGGPRQETQTRSPHVGGEAPEEVSPSFIFFTRLVRLFIAFLSFVASPARILKPYQSKPPFGLGGLDAR
jgi:hypothetical protein